MSDLVELQSEQKPAWHLHQAVLIYRAVETDSIGQRRSTGGAYATVHPVAKGKHGPELGAGAPATKEACADLARALGAASTLSGFIPPRLLFLGARTLAWWRPPSLTTMHFNAEKSPAGDQQDDGAQAKMLGKRGGRAPQPGLVFAVTPGDWYVYAVPGQDRPSAGTKIFRAPYFNVWASGRVCTGNVKLPETLSPAALEAYERAFFGSEFTHPNVHGRERLVNHAAGPYAFWRDMLDKKPLDGDLEPVFPSAALVSTNRTLGKLIEQIEQGKFRDD